MSGLRERKKERTREAIQREALRLIASRGYDATTCEQIAAAAEVSPATLYRYFATKEDVVLQDGYDPMIAEAIRARPAHESPLTAVRRGLADTFADVYQGDVAPIRQRTALILSVPALKARSREQLDSLVTHLRGVLAERSGRGHEDFDAEVAASTCAAALEVAVGRWARDGGDLPSHVDAAFAALGHLTSRPHG
ncbi:MAG: TetR/AcrR family transcriptional regulator [Actinomycetota bacterium]